MTHAHVSVPSASDFLTALGVAPDPDDHDGRWFYRFDGKDGLQLILSFDVHEGSFQTILMAGDLALSTVVHEGLERVWIEDEAGRTTVRAEFMLPGERSSAEVGIVPQIYVNWTTLRA